MSALPIGVAQQWSALSAARLRWALDAYRQFVDSLHEDIKSRFVQNQSTEAYVVVFGRTQVGKTTLLLELMGVRPDALARVSQVLRGGREPGKSATATAMEYSRSVDHRWRLRGEQEVEFETDAQLVEALATVREEMSQGRLVATRPLALAIPDDCFDAMAQQDGQTRTRILDLPGDNPKDAAERDHVNRMAQTYVPNADLILLVGRADDLSFLNPAALTLHSIKDWRLVPERFRIITTYSFTLASVRKQLQAYDGHADSEYFRQVLRKEIATFGLKDVESLPPQLFFPLEFGQSWQQAASQEMEMVERIGPVIDELKAALSKDIRESATEYGRLRSATQVKLVAQRVKNDRLQRWNTALANFEAALTALEAQIAGHDAVIARVAAVHREREHFKAAVQEIVTPAALDTDPVREHWRKPDKSRDKFVAEIRKRKDMLSDHVLCAVDKSRKALFATDDPALECAADAIDFDAAALRRSIDEAFRSLLARLDGYTIDSYHTWTFMSAYDDDISRLRQSTRHAEEAATQLVAQHWNQAISALRTSAQTDYAMVDGEHRQLLLLKANLAKKQQSDAMALEQDKRARDEFREEMDREGQAGERFKAMLEMNYKAQFMQYRNEARNAPTTTRALLKLLAARQLMNEKHKVMMGEL